MIRTRFMVAATAVALAAGCAGAPPTSTAPGPDRQVASIQTVTFTAADIDQMRKVIPERLTEEQARKLIKVDPGKVRVPGERQTQVGRFGGFGRGFGHRFFGGHGFGGLGFGGLGLGSLGFWPYTFGGLGGLYWPYTWGGGYWNLHGSWPYTTIGNLWYPYGYGWGGLW